MHPPSWFHPVEDLHCGTRQHSSANLLRYLAPARRLSCARAQGRRHRARSRHAARQRCAVDLAGRPRGRERDRLDPLFRRRATSPSRRRRGQGFRSLRASSPPKEARRLERNVMLARRRREGGGRRRAADGFDPTRVGIVFGSAIGGVIGLLEQADVLRERGPDRVSPFFLPNVLVDSASGQLAITLGIRGPNYAVVSACATGSHAVGEAAELIKRGDADAVLAGGTEACMHPLILAGFCAMRGLAVEEEHPPRASRPFDATRAGFVMGEGACVLVLEELEPRACARRDDLRRGARLRRVERRSPHGAARSRVGRRRGDDARGAAPRRRRARARRLHQRARDVDAARRRWPRRERSRTSSASTRTSSRCRRRSR